MVSDTGATARRVYGSFPTFEQWQSTGFDTSTYDRFAALFAEAKDAALPEHLDRVVATATRWAAVDTGAIEGLYAVDRGFTITVAASAATLDTIHLVRGEQVERAIKDAVAGYEYVLDLATGARPVSEQTIKELHVVLCASQDTYRVVTAIGPQDQPLPKGVYKTQDNSPFNLATGSTHAYAPVIDTPPEMARLVDELRSEPFVSAHPVLQASYAHYAFVCVHPFADGNGRVSRALASAYLYRSPGVPLVVFADQKNEYIDALEAADSGRPAAFSRFVEERAIDTVQWMLDELRHQGSPDIASSAQQLSTLLFGRGGLTHLELDAIAVRVLDAFRRERLDAVTAVDLPRGTTAVQFTAAAIDSGTAPSGYRAVRTEQSVVFSLSQGAPVNADVQWRYEACVALPATVGADLMILRSGEGVVLDTFLRQASPELSTALSFRLETAARREVEAHVAALVERAAENLRSQGYV